jgi:hypothetical protein
MWDSHLILSYGLVGVPVNLEETMATIPSNFNRYQPSSQGRGIKTISPRPAAGRQSSVSSAAILRSLAKEPEDAGLTGGTRSLDRRLLALNFGVSANKIEAVKRRVGLRPAAA